MTITNKFELQIDNTILNDVYCKETFLTLNKVFNIEPISFNWRRINVKDSFIDYYYISEEITVMNCKLLNTYAICKNKHLLALYFEHFSTLIYFYQNSLNDTVDMFSIREDFGDDIDYYFVIDMRDKND